MLLHYEVSNMNLNIISLYDQNISSKIQGILKREIILTCNLEACKNEIDSFF